MRLHDFKKKFEKYDRFSELKRIYKYRIVKLIGMFG